MQASRQRNIYKIGGTAQTASGLLQSYKKLEEENKSIGKGSWKGTLTLNEWTLIKGLHLLSSNQPTSCLCAKLNYREQPLCRIAWSPYLRRLGNIIAMSVCIVSKKCPFCFLFQISVLCLLLFIPSPLMLLASWRLSSLQMLQLKN